MDDYETFKNKMVKYEEDQHLKECNFLSELLNNSIKNKVELTRLDKSYYWKCNSVKNIMKKNDLVIESSTIHDISIIGLQEQIKGDYLMPYINTIDLKTKKLYFDEDHYIDTYYGNKYKKYEAYFQWKEVIDMIDNIKIKKQ